MAGAVAARRGAAREAAGELTVDQLSVRTGVSSRTIRFYQTEEILPAPLRRGRIALYGEIHVERLKLVSMLQARGLRLSAIRDVLRRARPESVSMRAWLGLDEALRTPWNDDEPRLLDAAEVGRLLANHGSITAAALQDADLVREVDGGWAVPSPALLQIALQLDAAGIDLDTAVAAAAIIRERLAPAAQQLVAHFAERVGRGFGRAATPADLAGAFDVLRPLGVEAVRIVFGQEVQRAIRTLLGAASPEAEAAPVRSPHVDRRSREGRRRFPRSRPRR